MKLFLNLFGYRWLETDRAHAAALLNLCLAAGVSLPDFAATDGGGIRFRLGSLSAGKIIRAAKREAIPLRETRGGLPFLLRRFRARAGLLAGAVCAVFLLVLSQRFVWSVRVIGNDRLTAGDVRRQLAGQGLEVGSYIPSLRVGEIETRVLLLSDDVAWIAVHLDGTVAVAQVVERAPVPEKTDRPANLIAARDGQIEGLELYRGHAAVGIGQPVRAGDLLVSGVYDSATVGYRYTRASGRVLARTERILRVEIPLSYEEKVYGKEQSGGIEFHFFKFSLNFSKNSRKSTPLCDIIETTTGNDWLGLHDLPVSLLRRTYRPYDMVPAERTAEQALELAYAELDRELSGLSPEVQLVGKRVATTITDAGVILECTLDCVENIAVQVEFDVVG